MPIVQYKPGLKTPSVFSSELIDKIYLKPGVNNLSVDEVAILKNSPVFKGYLAKGIVVIKKEQNPEPPIEIKEVQIDQGSDILQSEFTLDG